MEHARGVIGKHGECLSLKTLFALKDKWPRTPQTLPLSAAVPEVLLPVPLSGTVTAALTS